MNGDLFNASVIQVSLTCGGCHERVVYWPESGLEMDYDSVPGWFISRDRLEVRCKECIEKSPPSPNRENQKK